MSTQSNWKPEWQLENLPTMQEDERQQFLEAIVEKIKSAPEAHSGERFLERKLAEHKAKQAIDA